MYFTFARAALEQSLTRILRLPEVKKTFWHHVGSEQDADPDVFGDVYVRILLFG